MEVPGHPGIVAPYARWLDEQVTLSADEVLAAEKGGSAPAKVEAEDFLRLLLGPGPRPTTEIEAEAKQAGISWATVRRAKSSLGVLSRRAGGLGEEGYWEWSLPLVGRDRAGAED
jgi:putative DNA primase/helicase